MKEKSARGTESPINKHRLTEPFSIEIESSEYLLDQENDQKIIPSRFAVANSGGV